MTRNEILKVSKPILFNTEMVRAILDGRKTVTRRAVKMKYGNTHIELRKNKYGSNVIEIQNNVEGETFGKNPDGTSYQRILAYRDVNPPFKVGDYLYVRETWSEERGMYIYKTNCRATKILQEVRGSIITWHPSIHMPKEAARIFLRVTDVRVERLWDITPIEVVRDEGTPQMPGNNEEHGAVGKADFIYLWDSTIKKSDREKYGGEANPWVWVIAFERVEVER